jgi:oligopeptide transport system permease protein
MNRLSAMAVAFLVFIATLSVAAPFVTQQSYDEQQISERLQGPSTTHWMGTDSLGRDLFSRVLYGGRLSLLVGVATALFTLVLGTATGALAGFRGGWVDLIIMRTADAFATFPSVLLAILLGIFLGRGVTGILLAIGLTSWIQHARLVRGQVLLTRELPYIEAARALGVSPSRILFRHLLPNLWGPILVSLTLQIPANIMAESFLSFIGLGLEPPYSSWGTLANEGFRAMRSYPHLVLFPGGVLFLTLISFNLLGDGIRDLMDPRVARQFDSER